MTSSGTISGIRVTHDRASVDEIAAAGGDDADIVATLLAADGVEEAYVLQTCNRTELYVVTGDATAHSDALDQFVADVDEDVVVEMDHEQSLRHLMRVAAGLESMVLGEDRVIGQVREAYETAQEAGGIGPVFEEAITKAIHVGERVRTETKINEGSVSLGSAAAGFLSEDVDLSTATGLVVGAGDIAAAVAATLVDRGIDSLVVANRTAENARALADDLDADAETVSLSSLPAAVDRADVVATATGSRRPLIGVDDVAGAGRTCFVDLARPRDVAPGVDDLPSAHLYDLDDLQSLTAETRERRRDAAEEAEEIIDREFQHLLDRFKRKRADEVIAAMHGGAERVKQRELRTALGKLEQDGELTDEQREVVESLADTLVSQLLAAPTKSLREAAAEDDWTTIATALQLFDPEFGSEAPPVDEFAEDRIPEAVRASFGVDPEGEK